MGYMVIAYLFDQWNTQSPAPYHFLAGNGVIFTSEKGAYASLAAIKADYPMSAGAVLQVCWMKAGPA